MFCVAVALESSVSGRIWPGAGANDAQPPGSCWSRISGYQAVTVESAGNERARGTGGGYQLEGALQIGRELAQW